MTEDEEREIARRNPRQLELPFASWEPPYRIEIDWPWNHICRYPGPKSPIINTFDRDKKPIRSNHQR